MNWTTAAQTHTGMRRKINEDSILARPDDGLWVVADGMGGHEAGDVASQMVTSAFSALTCEGALASFVDQIEDLLLDINRQLREHASAHFGGRTMGCTVVSMLSRGNAGVALWAGDSRLYRLRGDEFVQITRDHSPLEELLEQGAITDEEAARHPDANVITRAIGGQAELFIDIILFDVADGDIFLLCSDGLYREVEPAEMHDQLASTDVHTAVAALLELSLARGARDNVSVIASRFDG